MLRREDCQQLTVAMANLGACFLIINYIKLSQLSWLTKNRLL